MTAAGPAPFLGTGLRHERIPVFGLDASADGGPTLLTRSISTLSGVTRVTFSDRAQVVCVDVEPYGAPRDAIVRAIERYGFRAGRPRNGCDCA